MAIRDLLRTVLVSQSLPPAPRVNGTATGNAVDLRGFDAAVITVSFGAYTDGTHTPSVLESVDGVNYIPCAVTDLDGVLSPVSSAAGSNTIQQVGYIGSQRYLQVVMTVTGATAGAVSGGNVIAGYPRNAPTQ